MRLSGMLRIAGVLAMLASPALARQTVEEKDELPKGIKDLEVGALWYLSYQSGETNGTNSNDFKVKRGYINITKKLTPWFDARITPDVHQDDTGDLKVRLKYAYAKFKMDSDSFIYKPWLEFGLVHTPWLDFEEHVNMYRLQDTMFAERNHNFNSADYGVTFGALLGGEIDKDYQKTVTHAYPGKYGSFAVGVYNGGGYHAKEKNENKALEARLTIRPVPDSLPGLQFSYFGVYGDGNVAPTDQMPAPDWRFNMGQVSYEHRYVTLTGEYLKATGNQGGSAVDADGKALPADGYSFFAELKLPDYESSIIGRWDHFDPNTDASDDANDRYIVGYAYHLPKHSMLLLDYERLSFDQPDRKDDWRVQGTIQVHYP